MGSVAKGIGRALTPPKFIRDSFIGKALNFVPGVGQVLQIGRGLESGNWGDVIMGAAGFAAPGMNSLKDVTGTLGKMSVGSVAKNALGIPAAKDLGKMGWKDWMTAMKTGGPRLMAGFGGVAVPPAQAPAMAPNPAPLTKPGPIQQRQPTGVFDPSNPFDMRGMEYFNSIADSLSRDGIRYIGQPRSGY